MTQILHYMSSVDVYELRSRHVGRESYCSEQTLMTIILLLDCWLKTALNYYRLFLFFSSLLCRRTFYSVECVSLSFLL